jgi:hypothetical protein
MKSTRILLVGLPRLLEEIVSDAVAQASDLTLAGTTADASELAEQAAASGAAVVVFGSTDESLIASALERQPHLAVFAVSADARSSSLYVLRPQRTLVGDLSPASFVAAIRAAAEPATSWWAR